MKYDYYYCLAIAKLNESINRINKLESCQVNYILHRQNNESGRLQIIFIDNQ